MNLKRLGRRGHDALRPEKTASFTLRLSFEERAALEQEAADMALGAYIRSRVFDQSCPPRRTRGKRPVMAHAQLAKFMAALGNSRLSSNVNQFAHAVNSGSLPVTPDTEKALIPRREHPACPVDIRMPWSS
jgi:hypothetical protein